MNREMIHNTNSYNHLSSSSDLCSPVVLVCDSVHTVCYPAGVESAVHYIKRLQGVHAQKTDKQHGHSKNNQTYH